MMIYIWQVSGFYIVIYLSGLQTISPDLTEAAKIDGADHIQIFFRITIPLLKPTLFFGKMCIRDRDTDCRKLLPGADFVIISVAIDREACWEKDHEIALKYGIIHYAENGGPGGFFHAARNIALLMPVFRSIEELCPNALVLNFTNPMTRICTAAARYTKLKMVGICHQIDFGYMMAGRILAVSYTHL